MSTPNWSALVAQGRAKAFGVPWTDEELKARYELGIPADFVREGCLTLSEYDRVRNEVVNTEKTTGAKPLRYQSKAELLARARLVGITATEDATRNDLIDLIQKAESKLPPSDEGSLES